MSFNYKSKLINKDHFLNSNSVSRFIDYLPFDDNILQFENENKTTDLIEKLNIEIQTFQNYFNIFYKDPIIENQNNLIFILQNLNKSLRFYTKIHMEQSMTLQYYPYKELFHLISTNNIEIIISLSFECLSTMIRTDFNFNINIIPNLVIEKLLSFITDYSFNDSICIIVELISILIQNSPQLCNLFISNGLFHVFDDWVQAPFGIFALESTIISADSKYISTILNYCQELLISTNNDLVNKSFHCFIIFIHRFGFYKIDRKNISLLIEIIPRHIKMLKSALELCLLIPNDIPHLPNIFNQILELLSDPVIEPEIHSLCLSIMIHFHPFWKNCMQKEDIYNVLFFGAENKEYQLSVKFAECIILYHSFGEFSFDLSVFNICLKFLDSKIYLSCLKKMYEIMITDINKYPNQISQMFDLIISNDAYDQINNYSIENGEQIANLILEFLSSQIPNEFIDQ